MAEPNASEKVYKTVEASLSVVSERELWAALRSELERSDGGPLAMKEFLDAEALRIKQIVEQSTNKVARV